MAIENLGKRSFRVDTHIARAVAFDFFGNRCPCPEFSRGRSRREVVLDPQRLAPTDPVRHLWVEWKDAYDAERAAQADLVRCVLGNPWGSVIVPAWRTPEVVELATKIYDTRRFEDLPILARALARAGCRDEQILEHLRGPGPHALGCHVLDALTGRAGPVAGSEVGPAGASRLVEVATILESASHALRTQPIEVQRAVPDVLGGLRRARDRLDEILRHLEDSAALRAGGGPVVRRIRRFNDGDGETAPSGRGRFRRNRASSP